MGLFTRKDSAAAKKGNNGVRARPSVPSEIQAAELRARARRRLAGSVVLVLAAVIILPMVLDSRPVPVADDIPVRIPERDAPYQPTVSDPQAQLPAAQPQQPAAPAEQPAPLASGTPPAVPPVALAPPPAPEAPRPQAKPEPKPAEPKPAESKPEAKRPARSDDGSVALALLEGRKPAASTPAKSAPGGNFVLQIAAYGTQADAQARNAKLHQSGITNAYVEPSNAGGKSQFRLRVGPFPSREAAQAAQARLRALGYDNGFIAAQ